MDRFSNSNIEKQTIYEIYRACRLCGAGGGYKMPIIQSVVDTEASDVELKQKIRECVQIEVHQDDKMPPLICELCVDKINDFFEFLEMCRQTNKQTRLRLGLPPQAMPQGVPDAEDCILGVTEPVYVNRDTTKSTSKDKTRLNKMKIKGSISTKTEPQLIVKLENNASLNREVWLQKRHSGSQRATSDLSDEEVSLAQTRKSILKPASKDKEVKVSKELLSILPESSKLVKNMKRLKRDDSPKDNKTLVGPKKVRLSPGSVSPKLSKLVSSPRLVKRSTSPRSVKLSSSPRPATRASSPRPSKRSTPPRPATRSSSPKSAKRSQSPKATRRNSSPVLSKLASRPVKRPVSPQNTEQECNICLKKIKTAARLKNHLTVHDVLFTPVGEACNACGDWFPSADEASDHHRNHHRGRQYRCRRCSNTYKHHDDFNDHLDNDECLSWDTVPDVKCSSCWRSYPTQHLLDQHKCQGPDGRPGGKCKRCSRTYSLLKNLTRHEKTCTYKRKGEFFVDDETMSKLRPFQIRIAKCDNLLSRIKWGEYYDVATVDSDFDLDKSCTYPFRGLRRKSEFSFDSWDHMVNINDDVSDFESEDEDDEFVYWDSKYDSDSDGEKQVQSLVALTLKVVFSKKCMGRVPKRKKGVRQQKEFDSIVNTTEDRAFKKGIDNIIDNLNDDSMDVNETLPSDKINDTLNNSDEKSGVTNSTSIKENNIDKHNIQSNTGTSNNVEVDKNHISEEKHLTKDGVMENSFVNNVKCNIGVANSKNGDSLHTEDNGDKKLMDEIDEQIGESKADDNNLTVGKSTKGVGHIKS